MGDDDKNLASCWNKEKQLIGNINEDVAIVWFPSVIIFNNEALGKMIMHDRNYNSNNAEDNQIGVIKYNHRSYNDTLVCTGI